MIEKKEVCQNTPLHKKASLLIFGVLLSFILLEIGLRLGGLAILSFQDYRNRISLEQRGEYKIMCVGESTTAGRYPFFLEEAMNRSIPEKRFRVLNVGVTGLKTDAILYNIESHLNEYRPDIVVTMMGINDCGAHMPYDTASALRRPSFLKNTKVYNLFRFLRLRIINKLKESKFNHPGPGPGSRVLKDMDMPLNEGPYKTIVRLSPWTYWTYLGLTGFYQNQDKFSRASKTYEKTAMFNPRNYRVRIGLGWFYQSLGKFSEAESQFNKALQLNPDSCGANIGLGWFYHMQENYALAEKYYKKAIEIDPCNYAAYTGLGWSYHKQQKHALSEESYSKAIMLKPGNPGPYMGIGWLYRDKHDLNSAKKSLKEYTQLNPNSYAGYIVLSWLYEENGETAEAEKELKKATELNPREDWGFSELGRLYQESGRFSEAVSSFQKAAKLNPKDDTFYGALRILYEEMSNHELAAQYEDKAKELRLDYYIPITIKNYHKLKEIVDSAGVPIIFVQYPMRSVEPLKKIFEGEQEKMIFVDNEQIFRDAVQADGYKAYFKDLFAGDFGHCTDKGDKLLAENVARVILREFFNKE